MSMYPEAFVPELDAIYPGTRHVEITDPVEIRKQATSHTSACWGSGKPLDLGYVMLCSPSQRGSDLRPVFVCKKAAYDAC